MVEFPQVARCCKSRMFRLASAHQATRLQLSRAEGEALNVPWMMLLELTALGLPARHLSNNIDLILSNNFQAY